MANIFDVGPSGSPDSRPKGRWLPNINGEIPRNRFSGFGDFGFNNRTLYRIGYDLTHQFNNNWSLRNMYRFTIQEIDQINGGILALLPDQRTVTRFWGEADSISRSHLHNMVTNLTGHFTILNMDHTLQARVSRDGSATVQTVDAGHATAWLRGRLVVARTSLSEVIHEIQRYHHGYILIASPALQHIQITGIYDLSNTAETLAVLAKTTPLKMTRMTDRFVILR